MFPYIEARKSDDETYRVLQSTQSIFVKSSPRYKLIIIRKYNASSTIRVK